MKQLGIFALCMALILGVFLPNAKVTAESRSITITSDSVNVRQGPGLSYPIVEKVNIGAVFSVLSEKDGWSKLQLASGKTGWVANWLLTKNDSMAVMSGLVTDNSVNIRRSPSTSSSILGKLSKGQGVIVYSKQNNWYEIGFLNSKAWVSSSFININNNGKSITQKGLKGTVTADGLHIRAEASLNSSIIGMVNKGQSFQILEEENNWDKVEYSPGSYGWIASWYLDKSSPQNTSISVQTAKESNVTILQDGTNIRKSASLDSDVILRANEGDSFPITKVTNDWYQVKLNNGKIGYVAGWIVSTNGAPKIEKPGAQNYLKNKTIVLDPGHGGQDNGTTGIDGTHEKDLTLKTAMLLYDKLRSSGANVILTRNIDTYISLPSRVSVGSFNNADAFISLHYDSDTDPSVRGTTGYYYHSNQEQLAKYLHSSLVSQTRLKDRGIRFGDFHVIRENSQKATLLELGYLSNPEEEVTMNSGLFQESAATGIYNGLVRYFMNNNKENLSSAKP